MEKSLLARDHPLIDLTLAKHCRHFSTARDLFFREPEKPAVRLALLSNRVVGGALFSGFPVDLFDRDEGKLSAYLAVANDGELCALFENPKLDDSFLRDFLEGGSCWQAMSEDKRLTALYALHSNERMRTPYDDSHMDGYAEYSHNAVFGAAWRLAETASATTRWAFVLNSLYDRIQPYAFSVEKPLEVATRWQPQDDETRKREMEDVGRGFLSDYQGVRKGLARLALAKSSSLAKALLDSEDVAFRSAAYAHSNLTVEQIGEAYAKDGELAFQEMVHNRSLWRQSDRRHALHDVAWAVVKNDKHSDLMAANIFNGLRDSFVKDQPDWFRDDEDSMSELIDGSAAVRLVEPATKADIEQIKGKLDAINSRLGFVWWFSLGALVGAFSRYL
ncbi:MAG: hypothetical protein JSR87_14235 [Proteobacteria bacterium]|nr:hypothetical protein [Pseudomonadota bacterium]MBS0574768.1 hypothetical protein [Pseudomonadota bacterium]